MITARHLEHAQAHSKRCACYKSEIRDPACEAAWPDICPWWAYQLDRHITGNYSGSAPWPGSNG